MGTVLVGAYMFGAFLDTKTGKVSVSLPPSLYLEDGGVRLIFVSFAST